jgi:hypothetical protein
MYLFSFTQLVSVCTDLLSCRSVGGVDVLRVYPAVRCWEGRHIKFAALGIFIAVIVVGLLPILSFWSLYTTYRRAAVPTAQMLSAAQTPRVYRYRSRRGGDDDDDDYGDRDDEEENFEQKSCSCSCADCFSCVTRCSLLHSLEYVKLLTLPFKASEFWSRYTLMLFACIIVVMRAVLMDPADASFVMVLLVTLFLLVQLWRMPFLHFRNNVLFMVCILLLLLLAHMKMFNTNAPNEDLDLAFAQNKVATQRVNAYEVMALLTLPCVYFAQYLYVLLCALKPGASAAAAAAGGGRRNGGIGAAK